MSGHIRFMIKVSGIRITRYCGHSGARDVLKLVIGQGTKLIGIGLGLGLVVAFIAARLMTRLLYQVSAADPLTYLFVAALLLAVALLACYIPARRATKIDPINSLRAE
jgi:putative ABC transport system permease protein